MSNLIDIKVVGCGGGGVNAINRMIDIGLTGVEFIALNTDAQALLTSPADIKLDIGRNVTKGLGAGADPEQGRLAAEENYEDIKDLIVGSDLVFLTAGMGGGTGTGSIPVVSKASKEAEALTIGIVTTPFAFEGNNRMKNALAGIEKLKPNVDTIITIPNDNLLSMLDPRVSMVDAFAEVDMVLLKGIAAIINQTATESYDHPIYDTSGNPVTQNSTENSTECNLPLITVVDRIGNTHDVGELVYAHYDTYHSEYIILHKGGSNIKIGYLSGGGEWLKGQIKPVTLYKIENPENTDNYKINPRQSAIDLDTEIVYAINILGDISSTTGYCVIAQIEYNFHILIAAENVC